MKTVIIDQARMTSTRLPGKVMKTVLGKPLLEYQIERLQRVKLADEIVIATTANEADRPIVELCERLNVPYFRGSEEDVLGRYYEAAKERRADVIVRVTSDCPIIDPEVIDKVIKFYKDHAAEYDYVSNTLERTYPRGMDCEVFPFSILEEVHQKAVSQSEREHVTLFIYRHPERYRLANVAYSEDQSHHRWTVDTEEDFELIERIVASLYPIKHSFDLKDCLELLRSNLEWASANNHIAQRDYEQ